MSAYSMLCDRACALTILKALELCEILVCGDHLWVKTMLGDERGLSQEGITGRRMQRCYQVWIWSPDVEVSGMFYGDNVTYLPANGVTIPPTRTAEFEGKS